MCVQDWTVKSRCWPSRWWCFHGTGSRTKSKKRSGVGRGSAGGRCWEQGSNNSQHWRWPGNVTSIHVFEGIGSASIHWMLNSQQVPATSLTLAHVRLTELIFTLSAPGNNTYCLNPLLSNWLRAWTQRLLDVWNITPEISHLWDRHCYCLHFTDEKTGAW